MLRRVWGGIALEIAREAVEDSVIEDDVIEVAVPSLTKTRLFHSEGSQTSSICGKALNQLLGSPSASYLETTPETRRWRQIGSVCG